LLLVVSAHDAKTFSWTRRLRSRELFNKFLDATMSFDVYAVPAQGGAKRKVCGHCGPTESLSPDGKDFLTADIVPPSKINLVDVASGESRLLLQHSQNPLSRPRFSPDGKWIAFLVTRTAGSLDVMLAPIGGSASVPEQDWITITPAPENVEQAFWSPDGGLVYYVINAGGSFSIMARHLDRNRRPAGTPFRVFEFPGRIHPQSGINTREDMLTAVPGRFIGALPELSFNVWMTDLPR